MSAAYEAFYSKPRQHGDKAWGDAMGERNRAATDVKACMARIARACPAGTLSAPEFTKLAAELPLLLAPAAFIWTSFEGALQNERRKPC